MRLTNAKLPLALVLLQAGCAPKSDSASFVCGLTSLSTPLAVQQGLAGGQALAEAPWNPPDSLPVRIVAGGLFQASISSDSMPKPADAKQWWKVSLTDTLPEGSRIGHGVLVVDGRGNNHGVLLFEGPAVDGAARIGSIVMAGHLMPLIGVRMNSEMLRDPQCPLFKSKAE